MSYTARFNFSGDEWLQAWVAFGAVDHPRHEEERCSQLQALIRSLQDKPYLRIAYRIESRKDGARRIVFVLGKASYEVELRNLLEPFDSLERSAAASVWRPATRQEHDDLIHAFPRYRCLNTAPVYSVEKDVWVGCNFRAGRIIPELMADAMARGNALSYHINLEPFTGIPHYREAKKNVARLRLIPGAPANLIDDQERLAEKLKASVYLGEEVLGVETEDARDWLTCCLRENFARAAGAVKLESPDFLFETEESTTMAFHWSPREPGPPLKLRAPLWLAPAASRRTRFSKS